MINCLFLILFFLPNQSDHGIIYTVGEEGLTPPEITKRIFPDFAKKHLKIEGFIIIHFVCRKNGEISDIKIVRSVEPCEDWDKAWVQAISKWEFKPGMKNGAPVDVRMTIKPEVILQ